MDRLSDQAINELTPEERLNLMERLWDSLDDADIPVTAAQRAELEHRLRNLDADIKGGISWEQLKAELNQRRS
ncbi:MAG TPA: addiction module protein [Stellaceae bacterium]|jgi:putative addiction module component (TIGR02574 family)|nr:addiction module protein [Stellaceae bacterium]